MDQGDGDIGIRAMEPAPKPVHGIYVKLAETGRCGGFLPELARKSQASVANEFIKLITQVGTK